MPRGSPAGGVLRGLLPGEFPGPEVGLPEALPPTPCHPPLPPQAEFPVTGGWSKAAALGHRLPAPRAEGRPGGWASGERVWWPGGPAAPRRPGESCSSGRRPMGTLFPGKNQASQLDQRWRGQSLQLLVGAKPQVDREALPQESWHGDTAGAPASPCGSQGPEEQGFLEEGGSPGLQGQAGRGGGGGGKVTKQEGELGS